MKKNLIIFFFTIIFCSSASADKLLKNGFINNNMNYAELQEVNDPKNKIILIYNHGQDTHDAASKNCLWKNGVRNMGSLVGEKVNEKEIMVYIFCTNHLAGDDKRLWKKKKFKPPYKGVTKLEKRLNANLELIDKFVSMGIPNKQIIITGQSCGGWMSLMLASRYLEKIGGVITTMPACYGEITKDFKVKKRGIEKALEKFRKKEGDGPADLREKQINEIKQSNNLPVLVFTHPMDPYEGLLSDWVEEIPGVQRIIISKDLKINGKKCKRIGINNGKKWSEPVKNAHYIIMGDCFQYYNPVILEYIASRTK